MQITFAKIQCKKCTSVRQIENNHKANKGFINVIDYLKDNFAHFKNQSVYSSVKIAAKTVYNTNSVPKKKWKRFYSCYSTHQEVLDNFFEIDDNDDTNASGSDTSSSSISQTNHARSDSSVEEGHNQGKHFTIRNRRNTPYRLELMKSNSSVERQEEETAPAPSKRINATKSRKEQNAVGNDGNDVQHTKNNRARREATPELPTQVNQEKGKKGATAVETGQDNKEKAKGKRGVTPTETNPNIQDKARGKRGATPIETDQDNQENRRGKRGATPTEASQNIQEKGRSKRGATPIETDQDDIAGPSASAQNKRAKRGG